MMSVIALAISVFVVVVRAEITPTESYTHSATLRSGDIKLYWKFDDTDITFEVHGQTTGWVGIGFSSNGAMTGADIYVGWVKNGQTIVTDRHGVGNKFPPLDPQQNIDVLGGNESDGWTMFKFTRQLAACEAEYDREITQDTQRLIYAWGEEDPTGDDLAQDNYHGTSKGAESMYFLQSAETPSGLPVGPTYQTFEFLMSNFAIPAQDTFYNCKLFKIPDFTKKQHIVKIEPVIQEGNELNVHHILVYRCGDVLQNQTELGLEAQCYTPNMQHFRSCSAVIASWAIGGSAFVLPDVAGLSVGAEGDPIYVQIEVHYDNPTIQSGIIDSSGIRFTYTDTIREHDMGILEVGVRTYALDFFIPPGAEKFLTSGYCTPFCMKKSMTDAGLNNVTAFSVLLHSHLAGRSLKLRHVRDGIELPYLSSDQTYDFNYQESRFLNPGVTVTSDDTLITECIYNTQDKEGMTEAGLSTRNEMCLSFVAYYPKIDLGLCFSSVSLLYTWSYLGLDLGNTTFTGIETEGVSAVVSGSLKSVRMNGSAEVDGKTVDEYFNEYNWTTEAIENFNTYYSTRPQYQICVPENVNNSWFEESFDVAGIITSPYVVPQKTCAESTTSATNSDATTTTSGEKITTSVQITTSATNSDATTTTSGEKITTSVQITTSATNSDATTTTSGEKITTSVSVKSFVLLLMASFVGHL